MLSVRSRSAGLTSAGGPGVRAAAVRHRTAAVQPGNYFFLFFLFFFLSFLLFLAMHITPLHEPVGQRIVDPASTYH